MAESSTSNVELKNLSHPPLSKKLVYKLAALILPKPFEQNDMEFIFGAWQGCSTATCEEGRPLGEDNALPAYHNPFTDTYYRIASFKDERHGKYYNVTALHHMLKDWQGIMSLYGHLRQKYIHLYTPGRDALSLMDLFVFSKLTVAIPAYLIRSANHEFHNGNIPGLLASQTKLVAGLFMVVRKMIEMGEPFLDDTGAADADQLYDYTTRHQLLISPHDKNFVCAGSEKMIRELMKITISGYDNDKIRQEFVDEYLSIIGDLEECFTYGMYDLQLELMVKWTQVFLIKAIISKSTAFNSPYFKHRGLTDHIKTHFPEEFCDLEKLIVHEKHLLLLLKKTGAEIPALQKKDDFNELYKLCVGELRTCALKHQNKINTLLGRKKLKNIPLKKLHKRLNIIPKEMYRRY